MLAWLPVESVIREHQSDYYAALAAADRASEATPFVEFMLQALDSALHEAVNTDQVSDQAADQVDPSVARLLAVIGPGESLKAAELMTRLGLRHRPSFRQNYLLPALAAGLLEMSDPDSPRSPTQTYRRVPRVAQ